MDKLQQLLDTRTTQLQATEKGIANLKAAKDSVATQLAEAEKEHQRIATKQEDELQQLLDARTTQL